MAYIRNFRGSSGNRAIISGSNVQVTGSLFGSAISGTTAQFTSLTGTYIAPLGSVTAPSYTFVGDSNTGIYSPSADTIAFVEGGTEVMRIDSTGRVGIGKTPTADKLEINGNVSVTGSLKTNSDLQANGGSLTSTATTFNLLNTTCTTVNFGGGAEQITVGNANGSPIFDLVGNLTPVFRIFNYTSSFVDGGVLGEFKLTADAGPSVGYGTRSTIRTQYEGVSGAAEVRIMAGQENNVNLSSIAGFGAKSGVTFYKNVNATTFAGNITLNNSDLVIGTSGNGISFANTTPDGTGASNISETLNDYEEGTFTPGAAATLGEVVLLDAGGAKGHYVKIGNIVTVFIELNIFSTSGTTQTVSITGLPFVSYSGTNSHTTVGFARIDNSGTNMILALVTNATNSTTLNLRKKTASSTTDTLVTVSDFNSSSVITVSFTYRCN